MNKFLVGSCLLGLANVKDTDYMVIEDERKFAEFKDGIDYRYRTLENVKETLAFKGNDDRKLFNYQLDKTINKEFGEILPYNLLDYKSELISYLKDIVKYKRFNFDKRVTSNNGHCTKIIYHIAYNLFIVENNSPIITAKQKAIIQKIHDRLMPIDYLDTLKEKIDKLCLDNMPTTY